MTVEELDDMFEKRVKGEGVVEGMGLLEAN